MISASILKWLPKLLLPLAHGPFYYSTEKTIHRPPHRKAPWKNQNKGECQPVPYVFFPEDGGEVVFQRIFGAYAPVLRGHVVLLLPIWWCWHWGVWDLRYFQPWKSAKVCQMPKIGNSTGKSWEHRDFGRFSLVENPGNSRSLRSFDQIFGVIFPSLPEEDPSIHPGSKIWHSSTGSMYGISVDF